jgi:thioredoxin 1
MSIDLNDDNFASVLTSRDKPLLVLFTSSFCGPSHALYPLIDDAIEQEAGRRYDYAEIDVEKCPKMTREYQIKGTPTLMFFDLGVPLASRAGTMSDEYFEQFVTDALGKAS